MSQEKYPRIATVAEVERSLIQTSGLYNAWADCVIEGRGIRKKISNIESPETRFLFVGGNNGETSFRVVLRGVFSNTRTGAMMHRRHERSPGHPAAQSTPVVRCN